MLLEYVLEFSLQEYQERKASSVWNTEVSLDFPPNKFSVKESFHRDSFPYFTQRIRCIYIVD